MGKKKNLIVMIMLLEIKFNYESIRAGLLWFWSNAVTDDAKGFDSRL